VARGCQITAWWFIYIQTYSFDDSAKIAKQDLSW